MARRAAITIMPDIHPTAVVDPGADLADDVVVGPHSVIGPNVTLGEGTRIGSGTVIEGCTILGRHNRVFHHALVGCEPQDLKYRGEKTTLVIGDHNDIRENVTIHVGTENGGGSTTVGSHNLFMVGSHIAHDSHVGDRCVLSNNVLLAGHIVVEDYAVIGGSAAITQYVTVGRYAYVGGLSGVVHDCPPFMVTDGHPAQVRGANLIGLARHRFDATSVDKLKAAYRLLWGRRGNCQTGLEALEQAHGDDPHIAELCAFVQRSGRQRHGRHAEQFRRDDRRSSPAR